jgi:hypothetical protein
MAGRYVYDGADWVDLGGGASSKTPSEVSGLVFHIDASTLGLVNTNPVTTWTDLASGNNPTQGTSGARPTFSTTYFTSAVLFDGSDDRLVAPAVATTAVDNFMIAVVCRPVASTASRIPLFNGVGSTNGWGVATRGNTGFVGLLRGGIAWAETSMAGAEAKQILIVRRTAGTWTVRANGITSATMPPAAFTSPGAPNVPATTVSVGSSYNLDPWNGHLAEGVIYNAAVSDADCVALETGWSQKWNVPVMGTP